MHILSDGNRQPEVCAIVVQFRVSGCLPATCCAVKLQSENIIDLTDLNCSQLSDRLYCYPELRVVHIAEHTLGITSI